MVQFFDASFAEGLKEDQQKITKPAVTALPATVTICCQSTRSAPRKLADLQLSYAHTVRRWNRPRRATNGRLPRIETESPIPRPAISRCRPSALHPAAAKGFKTGAIAPPTPPCSRSRARGVRGSASRASNGAARLFVVPSWQWVTHEADEDSVLFSFFGSPGAAEARSVSGKIGECVTTSPRPALRGEVGAQRGWRGTLHESRSLRQPSPQPSPAKSGAREKITAVQQRVSSQLISRRPRARTATGSHTRQQIDRSASDCRPARQSADAVFGADHSALTTRAARPKR